MCLEAAQETREHQHIAGKDACGGGLSCEKR